MISIEYGPTREDQLLSSGLDYYKPTMSQVLYEQQPGVETTFTLKNRSTEILTTYVPPAVLQSRLDTIQERGWQPTELDFFSQQRAATGEPLFNPDFIDYLATNALPRPIVGTNPETGELTVQVSGEAAINTFWETVVMGEINELYFENYVTDHGLDLLAIYDEGDRRLSDKIAVLQSRPDIKFADFGTRRHFSLRWQRHVVQRLQAECPDNLIGTSNVGLAQTLGLKPIGTFAHEMPMVYAGLAEARGDSLRASHQQFFDDWFSRYGADLSIALTDTFTSDFFFNDFTTEQATAWNGVRHDSGDAIEFGERVIAFYEANAIDPQTKTIVFSDGLDIDNIVALQDHFSGRIKTTYGWGTTLTNDLGIPALNIVMKVTHVRDGQLEADTVKLSDNPGKHTGPSDLIERYRHEFRNVPAAV